MGTCNYINDTPCKLSAGNRTGSTAALRISTNKSNGRTTGTTTATTVETSSGEEGRKEFCYVTRKDVEFNYCGRRFVVGSVWYNDHGHVTIIRLNPNNPKRWDTTTIYMIQTGSDRGGSPYALLDWMTWVANTHDTRWSVVDLRVVTGTSPGQGDSVERTIPPLNVIAATSSCAQWLELAFKTQDGFNAFRQCEKVEK